MNSQRGKLILFGSGETSPTGRKIHSKFFQQEALRQTVAILETPAGFQPNADLVAKEVAKALQESAGPFIKQITCIPARKKGTHFSPDNETILTPLHDADYLLIGPGSPSYTVRQLRDSQALVLMLKRWEEGATLALSSASALAAGCYTLPVYEIYKAGHDLYWDDGLHMFGKVDLDLTIVTHWDNNDGGKDLDTRFCYMGKDRFEVLRKLLPEDEEILGIDEHTAIIFDFQKEVFEVIGNGSIYLLKEDRQITFPKGFYALASIASMEVFSVANPHTQNKKLQDEKEIIAIDSLPSELQTLLQEREKAKQEKNFTKADEIRTLFQKQGYTLEDSTNAQTVYKAQ